ncbi:hypothetical protein A7U60_g458 [Sanghuangporus baumii]|uniref:Protein kinase domain-containing protein n=1 Tax=Sanghuangporus baumii TaxID=108892 RepID=A0A9Q5I5Z2_SANBA|nr:hypothetical protein A7U60_g458 [Sanghuangporus baumii]
MNLKDLFRDLFYDEPLTIEKNQYKLSDGEIWWRERHSLLESRGYRLRERLRPGWIPSWTSNPRLRAVDCEDSMSNLFSQITDAMRVSDGSYVIIKKVKKSSSEKAVAMFLSCINDPRNHCVPIIDSFADASDEKIEFLVMPLLRRFDDPSYRAVNEVVDFLKQTLEGIAFMHSKNIAHRDCSDLNIMLDGTSMYPDGFHPVLHSRSRSWTAPAKFKSRTDSPGVKYFFTDFGLSTRFDDAVEERLVTGRICQTHVPELSDTIPYDPFALDIYLLGDVYKRNFIEKYSNVQFLMPLVESMTRKDPSERPKADEALNQLEDIISQRSKASLRWRLVTYNIGRVSHFFINFTCVTREGVLAAQRMIGNVLFITIRTFEPTSLGILALMTDPLSIAQLVVLIPEVIDYSVKGARVLRQYKKINGNLRFSIEHAEDLMYRLRLYITIVQCTTLRPDVHAHLERALSRAHLYMTKLADDLHKWSALLRLDPVEDPKADDSDENKSGGEQQTSPSEAADFDEKTLDVSATARNSSDAAEHDEKTLEVSAAVSDALKSVQKTEAAPPAERKVPHFQPLLLLNRIRYLALGSVSIRECLEKLDLIYKTLSEFIPISQHLTQLFSYNEKVYIFTQLAKSAKPPTSCVIDRRLKLTLLEETNSDDQIFYKVTERGEYQHCIVEKRLVNDPRLFDSEEKETKRLAKTLREDKQSEYGVSTKNIGILRCCGYMRPNQETFEVIYRKPKGYTARTLRKLLTTPGTEFHPIEKRIAFALQLANAVHAFHLMGFVHKGIRPEAILVLEPMKEPHIPFYNIGTPFLAGFNAARYNESLSGMYRFDRVMNKKLYHEPRHLGKVRPQKYLMRDDVYSLGVCLLEIGLWRSVFRWNEATKFYVVDAWAKDLFADLPWTTDGECLDYNSDDESDCDENEYAVDALRKKKLINMAKTELNTKVNKAYCDAVLTCLTFGEQGDLLPGENGSYAGSGKFYEEVLCQLHKAVGSAA